MNPTKAYKYLKLAKKNDDLVLLYKITRAVAKSDSIGEGYYYFPNYNINDFKTEIKYINEKQKVSGDFPDTVRGIGFSGSYLAYALLIYKIVLELY